MAELSVRAESWATRGTWTISRGSVNAVEVVVAELRDGPHRGRGECRPYPRYGETVAGVVAALEGLRGDLAAGLDREGLQTALAAGAARNALDCALWDLEAKRAGCRVWDLAGLAVPAPVVTAYTLSLDSVENMKKAAEANAHHPLLKLKLAGPDDLGRVAAVRAGAPDSRIIVDANEGWTLDIYRDLAPKLIDLGVEMIEQPLPSADDSPLAGLDHPVDLCADESCHDRASLADLKGRYEVVNIKLDKTGGLTEALALKAEAEAAGFEIMVGCMLATSLAMAPAVLLTPGARIADLDGPPLLAEDRPDGLVFANSMIHPPEPALWG